MKNSALCIPLNQLNSVRASGLLCCMNSSNTDSVNLEHARKTKKKKKKKKSKTLIVKATEEIFSRAEAEANYKNIDKQDITDTGTERLDNSGSEDNDISQQEANDQSTSTNVKLSDSFEYMEPKNEIPVSYYRLFKALDWTKFIKT